jgi:hypothetical protein
MSTGPILLLSMFTGSFLVFSVLLAWGDHQTRSLSPRIQSKQLPQSDLNTNTTPAVRERKHSDALRT